MKVKIFLIYCFVYLFNIIDCNHTFDDNYDSKSRLGVFKECGVSTDASDCAPIGKHILQLNGTAADAMVSVLLCMGVTIPESMGLGGGGMFIFYNRTTRESFVIDGREVAPKAAKENMFQNANQSQVGPLAIAVPGQLAALWELHQRSGRLKWNQLFDGAIRLATNGFKVSEHLANAIKLNERHIRNHPSFRDIFFNKNTNQVYKQNETIVQKKLAQTLTKIANSSDPLKLFYSGSIAEDIINDINDASIEWNIKEIISLEDFKNYKLDTEEKSIKTKLKRGNLTLHTIPLPGTGILLSFILKVMENFDDIYPNAFKSLNTSVLFYHRLMETYKYAFSRRMLLGDQHFDNVTDVIANLSSQQYIDYVYNRIDDKKTYEDPEHYGAKFYMVEDHGTSHVSIIDKYGNAASVSSTVNMYFGSKILSKRTGLVLNDEMDDFSSNFTNGFDVPPSHYNLIEGGKRPLSSMCPSIFVDESGDVKLVIGASGGTKITTAVAVVAIKHLWMNETIKKSIDWPRIHHQLFPNEIVFESNFPNDILTELTKLGHKTKDLGSERGAIVMAVNRINKLLYANSDFRKGGDVDGF